ATRTSPTPPLSLHDALPIYAPNLSASLCRAAGAAVPVPAGAPARSQPPAPGAYGAGRAGARVPAVQCAVGVRCATRAARLHVERRPTPPHRPLDRLAAVGMDPLGAGRAVPPGKGRLVAHDKTAWCVVGGSRRRGRRGCRPRTTTHHTPPGGF